MILFFIVIILSTNNLFSMKRPLVATSERNHKNPKTCTHLEVIHPFLPLELREKILIGYVREMAQNSQTKEICNYVTTLSLINKKFNDYINSPSIIRPIINTICDNARLMRTPAQYWIAKNISIRGTKNYIAQNTLLYDKITGTRPVPYSIKELVTNGADVHFCDSNGYFLCIAVKHQDFTQTQILLELGANPNFTEFGTTALDMAIEKEDLAIIQLLLKFNPQNKGLINALHTRNTAIVKLLLAEGNLTEDELRQGHQAAFRSMPPNPASQILIEHFFANCA